MTDERVPLPLEDLLASGRRLLDDARRTIAEMDAAMNTAVVPIVVVGEVPPDEHDDRPAGARSAPAAAEDVL